jgi:hypothetical protein
MPPKFGGTEKCGRVHQVRLCRRARDCWRQAVSQARAFTCSALPQVPRVDHRHRVTTATIYCKACYGKQFGPAGKRIAQLPMQSISLNFGQVFAALVAVCNILEHFGQRTRSKCGPTGRCCVVVDRRALGSAAAVATKGIARCGVICASCGGITVTGPIQR